MIDGINQLYTVPHNSGLYLENYDKSPWTTAAVRYYDRYLLQKAMSVFEWKVPENWDLNYMLYNLYIYGYVCVTEFPEYGVIPQYATISGFNIYYNPARCIINNPYLPIRKTVNLGRDGELLTLTPDYAGILDVVNEYSEMLANAVCAVNTNLFNSRLSYIFYAQNKAQAESYKKMYDDISTGIPAIFIDKRLYTTDETGKAIEPYIPFNSDLKANYLTTDLLEDIRRIEHLFAQKIGLPNTNAEKKERLTTDEVNKTDVESVSNVCLWYDMIQKSIERIKTLYPDLTLECDFRFPIEEMTIEEEEE